jgi:hypothetical protein
LLSSAQSTKRAAAVRLNSSYAGAEWVGNHHGIGEYRLRSAPRWTTGGAI